MTAVRISVAGAALLFLSACSPKGPAPKQCGSDAECFAGGVCNAGGTCVTGAAIDKDKSTIDVSQPKALADGQDEVTVTVTLRDSAGNPLVSRGVRLSVDGTANTLTQPSLATNSVGQVTGKLTSTKAETKTIHAVAGIVVDNPASTGVALTKAGFVNFVADASHIACAPGVSGANCTASGDPAQASALAITAADGTSAPNVLVDPAVGVKIHLVLKDAHGNPVPGAVVNFNVVGTGLTLVPASGTGTTGGDGSFDATISSTVAQDATVIVDAGGMHVVKVVTFHPGPAAAAHSSVTFKVGTTACNPLTICNLAADGSDGLAAFTITAHDQYDNVEPNAQVWFQWGPNETGNTIATPQAQQDYCTALGATCAAQQQNPLLTMLDGRVEADYSSPKAEPKVVTVHVDGLTYTFQLKVVAGLADPLFSEFAVLGHDDGSPVVADGQAAQPDFWFLGAYVADKFDNPLQGQSITFTSEDCTSACVPVAGDEIDTVSGRTGTPIVGATNVTGADGIVEGNVFALKAGPRTFGADMGGILGVKTEDSGGFVPGDPAGSPHSTMSISPSSISSDPATGSLPDAAHLSHISITLRDVNDNATPNQDLALDALVGTTSGPSCTSCTFSLPTNNGATYEAYLASSVAQTLQVVAAVGLAGGGTLNLPAQQLTVNPGGVNANNSTVVMNTTGTPTANGSATASVTVTLKDTQGNLVPGQTLSPSVSPATGVSVSAVTPDGSGHYSFTFTSTKAEQKTVAVSVLGTPGPLVAAFLLAQTAQITFAPGNPNSGKSTLTASPTTLIDDDVTTASVILTALDANSNPVQGVAITFSATAGTFNPASGTTNSSGVVQTTYHTPPANTPPYTQGLNAQVGAFFTLGPTNITINGGSASPANSTLLQTSPACSGTCPAQTVGSNISLQVTERDPANAVRASKSVTLSCDGVGNTFPSGNPLTTDVNGQATFTVTSTKAVAQTCTVSDENGVPFKTVGITFKAGAANSSNSVIAAVPSSIPADFSTRSAVGVLVSDANGNPAPGLAVTFASSDALDNFTCSGTGACVTNSSGIATTQVAAKVAGTHVITATVPGMSPASTKTVNVTVTPGGAAKLAFSGPGAAQPTDVNAGAFMNQVKVAIQDQFGNLVTTASASVTLALNSTSGTAGTVSNGTVSTTGGIATFNALVLTGTAGGLGCTNASNNNNYPCRTFTATGGGLTAGTSNDFHVIPPNASTGGDGVFAPGVNTTLTARNGVPWNFTTITIPAGVRVTSDGNGLLDLRATGSVVINGVLDVSGGLGGSAAGQGVNGGGSGGGAGTTLGGSNAAIYTGAGQHASGGVCGAAVAACTNSSGGTGGGGLGGYGGVGWGGGGGGGGSDSNIDANTGGGAGGGGPGGGSGGFAGADGCVAAGAAGAGSYGGQATGCGLAAQGGGQKCPGVYAGQNGFVASSGCTTIAGSGGGGSIGCDAAADLAMASTLRPGSGGGGGGSGGDNNGEARSGGGGGGGGGGGAVRITSPTSISIGSTGAIRANGGAGGNGAPSFDDCVDDSGGGGGGGSGGAIYLQAPALSVASGGVISATGGGGGAAGTGSGPGGAGSLGRIRLSVDPGASSVSGSLNPGLNSGLTPTIPQVAGKTYVAKYPQ